MNKGPGEGADIRPTLLGDGGIELRTAQDVVKLLERGQ
jgi:hypothetical protein